MSDENPLSDLGSAVLTPQDLYLARLRQQQAAQQAAASAPAVNGRSYYGTRSAGLALGNTLARLGQNDPTLDQMAAQNQQILSAQTPTDQVLSGPTDPGTATTPSQANGASSTSGIVGRTTTQPTPDPYIAQANQYAGLAQRFLQAGNTQAASQFAQAAMVMRQQSQNAKLTQARISQENSRADQESAKAEATKADQQYIVVDSSAGAGGIPVYKRFSSSFSPYDDSGNIDSQGFAKARADALQAAKDAGAASPVIMSVKDFENSKANAASIRAQAQAAKAGASGQSVFGDDQGALDQATGMFALRGPSALTRMTAADRVAVLRNLTKHDLSYQDAAEAQLQYAALQHALNTGAARAGQVAFLSNEVPGQAKNVLDALNGVDRTRLQLVNKAIAAGKTEFGDPAEARYAVALNGLIGPYARLLGGATGVTSDSARDEAMSLLNKYQSPEQVRAVISQIVDHELATAKDAGEGVIEMARNSSRYSALRKIAEKLGVPVASLGSDGGTAGAGNSPSLPNPTAATGPSNAPPASSTPPQAALDYLRQHPESAPQFQQKYGQLPTSGR